MDGISRGYHRFILLDNIIFGTFLCVTGKISFHVSLNHVVLLHLLG